VRELNIMMRRCHGGAPPVCRRLYDIMAIPLLGIIIICHFASGFIYIVSSAGELKIAIDDASITYICFKIFQVSILSFTYA